MLYAIVFSCMADMSCSMSPDMIQYDERYIFHSLPECQETANHLKLPPNQEIYCVDQNRIARRILWWANDGIHVAEEPK